MGAIDDQLVLGRFLADSWQILADFMHIFSDLDNFEPY